MAGAGLGGTLLLDGDWDATLGDTLRLKASLARSSGDITVQAETAQGTSARVAAGVKEARLSLQSEGEAVTVALRWDSERAGTADGQLRTRLARAPATAGGGWLWPADAPLAGQLRAQLPRIGVWSVLAPPGWRLRGSLGADVAISGTRAAPQLAGDLQADDLALRSVVDGIEFGNGKLRAKLDGTRMRINEFTLQGAGDKARAASSRPRARPAGSTANRRCSSTRNSNACAPAYAPTASSRSPARCRPASRASRANSPASWWSTRPASSCPTKAHRS